MTEEEKLLLPAYLREAPENTGRVYGTLSYNRRSRCWTVKGDPGVRPGGGRSILADASFSAGGKGKR